MIDKIAASVTDALAPCVKRIYTDLATLQCWPEGLQLIDKVEDLEHAELEQLVGLTIQP